MYLFNVILCTSYTEYGTFVCASGSGYIFYSQTYGYLTCNIHYPYNSVIILHKNINLHPP